MKSHLLASSHLLFFDSMLNIIIIISIIVPSIPSLRNLLFGNRRGVVTYLVQRYCGDQAAVGRDVLVEDRKDAVVH